MLRTDLFKWATKQSKQASCRVHFTDHDAWLGFGPAAVGRISSCALLQVMSGFPAVAALMCCERHDQLVTTIDGFIDALHKLLRERRTATMAILCLCRVVGCFIRRMSPRSDARERRPGLAWPRRQHAWEVGSRSTRSCADAGFLLASPPAQPA